MTKVLIWIPTIDGRIPTEMADCLMNMDVKDLEIWVAFTKRAIIHCARNAIANTAIEWWYDYLMFLDDDTIPEQKDFLKKLLSYDVDMITWLYMSRTTPWLTIFQWKPHDKTVMEYLVYQPQDILAMNRWAFEVEWAWSWCCLIKVPVLKKIYDEYHTRPYEYKTVEYVKTKNWSFIELSMWTIDQVWDWDMECCAKNMSEDMLFFERARRMWYKLYATNEVLCKHLWGSVALEVK